MHKLQVFIIVVVIPLAAIMMFASNKGVTLRELFIPTTPIIHLDDIPMQVEIADSDAKRIRGLSGRESLPELRGLLMVFPKSDYHLIWMKDMRFSIDVIWISEDLKIVEITKYLTPESYPRKFSPPVPVKYVLETNVGYADSFGISVGDSVKLPLELR